MQQKTMAKRFCLVQLTTALQPPAQVGTASLAQLMRTPRTYAQKTADRNRSHTESRDVSHSFQKQQVDYYIERCPAEIVKG